MEGLYMSPRGMAELSAVKVSCMYARDLFFCSQFTDLSLELCSYFSFALILLRQRFGTAFWEKGSFFCIAVSSFLSSFLIVIAFRGLYFFYLVMLLNKYGKAKCTALSLCYVFSPAMWRGEGVRRMGGGKCGDTRKLKAKIPSLIK